jgi:hypothetical protein
LLKFGVNAVITSNAAVTINDAVATRAGKLYYKHLLSGKTINQSFVELKHELTHDSVVADKIQGCCCEHSHTEDCPWVALMNNEYDKKTLEEV